ncbi:hypothetical protein BCIN_09g04330 [Botrytis cinerea B05.10]|uniref:Uncharacterized protein n=2 Tax=Botryotinia fuckeliana TaxID=40559 RepID=A0A384JSR6_BOTFB|nr:hypothetical protein BCIN_09g04330 [Botrytis cinerea B05.10]ATZ53625.1 hypothetical protein BCIN_09g04330 [Botrytis cinerea B05.10]
MLITQTTNWLRMPSRELGSSSEAPNSAQSVGTTLLKRHKILPHPKEVRPSDTSSQSQTFKSRDRSAEAESTPAQNSENPNPRMLKHTSKRIGVPLLPPTPPAHSRQSSSTSSILVVPAPNSEVPPVKDSRVESKPTTPTIQKSPPTPDVTPPRAMPPLAFRPALASSRYPSSRTDSFRTAVENLYSSDEDESSTVRPRIPSAKPSEAEVLQIPRKEIGLGLGLESDNEGSTTPKAKETSSSQHEFGAFDGEWGTSQGEISEVEREWDDNLMRNVVVRKRKDRNINFDEGGANVEVGEDYLISSTEATKIVRELSVQEDLESHWLEKDRVEPMSKSGTWPRVRKGSAESPALSDTRRFSTMSGRSTTSTVVEAFVVDAPPSRMRTLRHTKKQIGLRDFNSNESTISSAPPSEKSSEQHHRLLHKAERIPERHNGSLTSITTPSITSSHKSRRKIIREGGVPVVVIPDRMSSAKSSKPPSLRSTSSRQTKRSNSLRSAPLSQSSRTNEPGYFDIVRPTNKRTMSESAGSSNSVHTIDYPPSIPTRRSSLSAPTSRNTSRAGSLTAESLKAHNMLQEKQSLKTEPVEASKPVVSEKEIEPQHARSSIDNNRLSIDHPDERQFHARRSTQATPFSQASYETAGTAATTAEISQAMAVSMVPHQNKSWTMIHRESEPSPPTLRRLITQPTVEVNGETTNGPTTPPQNLHTMDGVISPLRNPRAPPEPPAIKFIPPTPSDMSPGAAEERRLGFDFDTRMDDDDDDDDRPSSSDKLKRNFSLRRAFTNRRHSDVIIPETGLLKRNFSLSGRRKDTPTQTPKPEANPSTHYPSVLDQPADDSKLHPFWRPANFWDDLEENDNDSDDEEDYFPEYHSPGNRRVIPKRGLSGKLKRTFAILPLSYGNDDYNQAPLDRKTMRRSPSGNALRVVKQRSNNTLRREADQRIIREAKPGEFGHGFKEGNGGRIHTIPGLGLRIEYVGLKGLGKKLSERRREQRNAKLRATISGPRGLRNGIDEVLESRSAESRNVI